MTLNNNFKLAFAIIFLVTGLRVYYLSLEQFNLFFDEAQYWHWAQSFEWGFFSKPPMVSWLISLTTGICGDTEACIRLSSPLMHAITSGVVYFIAQHIYQNNRISFYSSVAYLTLPAVSLSSALISTDPPLLMFWAIATLFFIKAIKEDKLKYWIIAGIAAGFGMMSKYNMLLFLVSVLLYLSLIESNRKFFKASGFWTACVIAMIICLPNIFWNFNNGFASFMHTKANATGSGLSVYPGNMIEFLGSQFGVFGPIFFGYLLFILANALRIKDISSESKFLLCFILPLFLVILAVSLISRAHANWAAPVYIPAVIIVTAALIQTNRKYLVNISIALHVVAAVMLTNFYMLKYIPFIELNGSKTVLSEGKIKDPFKRVHGWKELGSAVQILLEAYPEGVLLTESRKIHSELLYYVKPHPFNAVKWNPLGRSGDHYELTTDINDLKDKDFIFVTQRDSISDVEAFFVSSERIGNIQIKPYEDYSLDYYIYRLTGFRGYYFSGKG
jgi:hypothetical protein